MLQILRIRTIIYCLRSFRYYNPYADDIKKSDTIAGNFETRYHKRKIIDYIYYDFFFFFFSFFIL